MSEQQQDRVTHGLLSRFLNDPHTVEYAELEEYVDRRYEEIQDQIREADMDEYEDQLDIVAWKGQQEELVNLLRHFEEGNDGRR